MYIKHITTTAFSISLYIAATSLASAQSVPVQNACPKDGCQISIASAEKSGEELKLVFDSNFAPEVARNHIHIYWDNFTADQVSKDAKSRDVVQGNWHPTDDYPDYMTQSDASVSARGDSNTLCVTAGDRDHNVIDSSMVHCLDVSDNL